VVSEPTERKLTNKDKVKAIIKKAPKSKFLTKSQEQYWDILEKNEITLCFGPAGVGKSFIAMKKAVDLLFSDNKYEKILIVRPAVEAEEKLGSLPGGMEEKLDPYTAPSFYLLNKIIGKEVTETLKLEGYIEVAALAYMRGWNVDNTILIFEEAQNATPNQMKLLLTRIGYNSKFFISGDLEQTDRYKDMRQTGLYDAKKRLTDLPNVGVFEFGKEDIVRNPLISEILKRYE
jgi:phosphate starvation-inducible PhoH-like protein